MYEDIKKQDGEVYDILQRETERQENNIELIASENFVSKAVLEAMGSCMTNKYAEGLPGKRYYGGCEYIDEMESLAIERAKKLFKADHANVQPHSGANANLAVYFACLKPGDTVLGMNLSEGGHLTHGSKVNYSGKLYNFVHYGVDPKTEMIDYDAVMDLAKEVKPKLIVTGASAYSRIIDFKKFREIADEVGAYLMADIAHIAGLVVTGLHPSPVPYADFVTTTTHKTLRGPRGAIILCKEEHKKAIDKAVFPGLQGGPLEHIIAAKAVCFEEDSKPEYKEYCEQVVKNAKVLSEALAESGMRIVSGGTDNHLFLLDVTPFGITGRDAEEMLGEVNITVNKNTIPNEKEKATVTSGIRIGTPAITSRGMKEAEMEKIAGLIVDTLKESRPKEEIKKDSLDLMSNFKLSY